MEGLESQFGFNRKFIDEITDSSVDALQNEKGESVMVSKQYANLQAELIRQYGSNLVPGLTEHIIKTYIKDTKLALQFLAERPDLNKMKIGRFNVNFKILPQGEMILTSNNFPDVIGQDFASGETLYAAELRKEYEFNVDLSNVRTPLPDDVDLSLLKEVEARCEQIFNIINEEAPNLGIKGKFGFAPSNVILRVSDSFNLEVYITDLGAALITSYQSVIREYKNRDFNQVLP